AAITGREAARPIAAARAFRQRAAAIDIGFRAILHLVAAGGRNAAPAGARAARAIATCGAAQPVVARRAEAAAVHVRLPAIQKLVVASALEASAGLAHPRLAIGVLGAIASVGARHAHAAAVHVGLHAILLPVGAARVGDGDVVTCQQQVGGAPWILT